ncbi:hypothetical protein DFH29DRAFT_932457 [Suillus ampliporus]|nr:hypothetical protein DFH29DRAFT_932457 [Suillus ampliporus]
MDSAAAKEIANNLLKSEDMKEAGETFYRQAVEHCHPASEDFVLRTKIHVASKEQRTMASSYTYSTQRELAMLSENCPYILLSPKHGLVHPGIDAIMFNASTLAVWLVQVTHGSHHPVSSHGLLFLLDVVRGTPYEPSPKHPWHLPNLFQLSWKENTQHFSILFWKPRVKPYIMQLHDTDGDVDSSNNPYEQWGFRCKAPQKSPPSPSQRLATSLAHLVPRSQHKTEPDRTRQDKMASEIHGVIIRDWAPGTQLLGEMTREQERGPIDYYVRDDR